MPQDRYVDDNQDLGYRTMAGVNVSGVVLKVVPFQDEKEAADTDTSVLRVARNIPHNWIPVPHLSNLQCDAISGATDVDIGLYKPNLGAVVDKDILLDGQTLASASAVLAPFAQIGAADKAYLGKTLRELVTAVSGTAPTDETYDIALTGNTFGANTGTICGFLVFAVPQG